MAGKSWDILSFHPIIPIYYYRASFVFSLQTWLAETPEQARKGGTPGYISVGMACEFYDFWCSQSYSESMILNCCSDGACGGRLAFLWGRLDQVNIELLDLSSTLYAATTRKTCNKYRSSRGNPTLLKIVGEKIIIPYLESLLKIPYECIMERGAVSLLQWALFFLNFIRVQQVICPRPTINYSTMGVYNTSLLGTAPELHMHLKHLIYHSIEPSLYEDYFSVIQEATCRKRSKVVNEHTEADCLTLKAVLVSVWKLSCNIVMCFRLVLYYTPPSKASR